VGFDKADLIKLNLPAQEREKPRVHADGDNGSCQDFGYGNRCAIANKMNSWKKREFQLVKSNLSAGCLAEFMEDPGFYEIRVERMVQQGRGCRNDQHGQYPYSSEQPIEPFPFAHQWLPRWLLSRWCEKLIL
jgi:hypothetical protein